MSGLSSFENMRQQKVLDDVSPLITWDNFDPDEMKKEHARFEASQPRVDSFITDLKWKIVPTHRFEKKPICKWKGVAKLPKVEKGQNYQIICGEENGIIVVDCDRMKPEDDSSKYVDGVKLMRQIIKLYEPSGDSLWDTPVVKTPNKGLHFYFKYNEKKFTKNGVAMVHLIKNGIQMRGKIDVKGDDGLIVGPGSVYSNRRYKWKEDYDPDRGFCELPDILDQVLSGAAAIDISDGGFKVVPRIVPKPIRTIDHIHGDHDVPEFIVRDVVMNLNPDRADNRDDWMKVLFGIQTACGDSGLPLAVEFSQQSPKFNSSDEVASTMAQSNGSISVGSLWHFLKEDNPKMFNQLYAAHRSRVTKDLYYRNYRDIATKAHEDRLQLPEVIEFLKATCIKVDNGGSPVWLTKNKRTVKWFNHPIVEYDVVSMPFQGREDIEWTVPGIKMVRGKEENVDIKMSVGKTLCEYSKLLDYPCYDRLENIPYLRREDVHYDEKEVFNLFSQYPLKFEEKFEVDLKYIQPMLFHMNHVICNNDAAIVDYLPKWLAHMFQKPWERPDVAIVMTSIEGTGKSKWWEFIGNIIGGKLYRGFNNANQITKKFNKLVEGALLISGCEAKDNCEKFDIETFKSMITEEYITIEPKGVDPYTIQTFARYVILSNNSCPLRISRRDRRIAVFGIDDDKLQSREYYADLARHIHDRKMILHMFHYFCQLDISSFDPRRFPETNMRINMKLMSMPQPLRYLKSIVDDEFKPNYVETNKKGDVFITVKHFYEEFDRWRLDSREGSSTTKQNFKLRLHEANIRVEEKRRKIHGISCETYRFCLKLFAAALGTVQRLDDLDEEDLL